MNLDKMTGLELMQFAMTGTWDDTGTGISSVVPMKISEVGNGHIVIKAKADERHSNPLGAVHGGFAATVLDSATGCAVHTTLPAGAGYGTVDLNIKMMRPVPFDAELHAVGRVINKSRRLAVAEASLTDEAGKVLAHATATCMIVE